MPDPKPRGNFRTPTSNTADQFRTAGNITRRESSFRGNSGSFNPLVPDTRSSGRTNSANNVWRDRMVYRRSFSLSDVREQTTTRPNKEIRPATSGAAAPGGPQAEIRERYSWISRFPATTGEYERVQDVHEALGNGQAASIRHIQTTGGASFGLRISALPIGDHEEAHPPNFHSTDHPQHLSTQHRRSQLRLGTGGTAIVRRNEEGSDGSWASTGGRLPRGSNTTNRGSISGSRVYYDQQEVMEPDTRALAFMRELHLRRGGDKEQDDILHDRPSTRSADNEGQLEKPSFLNSIFLAMWSFFGGSPDVKPLDLTDSTVDTAIKAIGDSRTNFYNYIELSESLRLTAKDVGMNLVGSLCLVNDDTLSTIAVTDVGRWVEFSADRDYYCILYDEFEEGRVMQKSPESSWKHTGRWISIS